MGRARSASSDGCEVRTVTSLALFVRRPAKLGDHEAPTGGSLGPGRFSERCGELARTICITFGDGKCRGSVSPRIDLISWENLFLSLIDKYSGQQSLGWRCTTTSVPVLRPFHLF